MEELGIKIMNLRKAKNMTLEELGEKVGVGKSTVRKWENGMIKNMRRDNLQKIADALGVSPSFLMGYEEDDDSYYLNDNTKRIAQEIYENKELSLLFDAAKDASPEDLQTVHTMLLALKKKENND